MPAMPTLATLPTIGGAAVTIARSDDYSARLTATCQGCTSQKALGSISGRYQDHVDTARNWAQDHALNCWATKRR
ncbi:hypothetical protein [Streptomyces goshikiensis]|uniref:hypothetical protein n=1 Tax=Streptomyces goshikiensis TaxID=1942 RepID=UPI003714808D